MVWLVLGWTSTSAARTRCFAETGFCVSDPILAYWEKNGGLAVFGYPLGVLHDETIEGSNAIASKTMVLKASLQGAWGRWPANAKADRGNKGVTRKPPDVVILM